MIITFKGATFKDGCLCLPVFNKPQARQFVLEQKDKEYTAEIKESHNIRSHEANAYMWKLCQLIADATHQTKEDVYIDAIRDIGVFKQFVLSEDEYKTFSVAWKNMGLGWPCEVVDYTDTGRLLVNAYYGSSTYSTKRMSRLIDNLVQDCKALDIEVLSPDKLAAMVDAWKPKKVGGSQ